MVGEIFAGLTPRVLFFYGWFFCDSASAHEGVAWVAAIHCYLATISGVEFAPLGPTVPITRNGGDGPIGVLASAMPPVRFLYLLACRKIESTISCLDRLRAAVLGRKVGLLPEQEAMSLVPQGCPHF